MKYGMITDSKIITPCCSHSLSGLELMFNDFISLLFNDIGVIQEMILKKHGVKIQDNRSKSGIAGPEKSPLRLHKSNLSDPDNNSTP